VQDRLDPSVTEPRADARRLVDAPSAWRLCEATPYGLFRPLGRGDAAVAETLHGLDEHGHDGWPVLEQDTACTADEPAVTSASVLAARASIDFLNSAHKTEEINR